MVQFLDTVGISNEVSKIFNKSQKYIIIISPYLNICNKYREDLRMKNDEGVEINVVYGKTELNQSTCDWFETMSCASVYYRKSLHAKCYMNESEAVIASMNLYEYSQINNDEMGLAVYRDENLELYDDIYREVNKIIENSDVEKTADRNRSLLSSLIGKVTGSPMAKNIVDRRSESKRIQSDFDALHGYCIRCGVSTSLDTLAPYCDRCMASWERYSNYDYEEKSGHCHVCGGSNVSSYTRPVCKSCYVKYKGKLIFMK